MSERQCLIAGFIDGVSESKEVRKPLAEAVAAPLPPHITPSMLPSLEVWPPEQRTRDHVVRILEMGLVGPSYFSLRYGAVPEPEAKRAAAAIEAGAFAFATEYAAGATLASDRDRFEVGRAYCKAYAFRLSDYFESRPPPPAASAGTMKQMGHLSRNHGWPPASQYSCGQSRAQTET